MKSFLQYPFLLLLMTAAVNQLQAQELHIYYNLHTDEIRYEKAGAPLESPTVKNGDEIVLHLTEFNHYLYRAELEINQQQFVERSAVTTDASLMSGLMPGLPTPGFSGLMGMGNNATDSTSSGGGFGLLNIPLLTINDNPITLSSLFGGSRGSEELLNQLGTVTTEISTLLEEMDAISSKIKDMRNTALVSQMANEYVEVLKKHPKLKPTFVKDMCREYYEAIFRKSPDDDIRLNDVLSMQDDALKYSSLIAELQSNKGELNNKVNRLDGLFRQLKRYQFEDADYLKYSTSLEGFIAKSKLVNQQLAGALGDSLALSKYPTPVELANLQLKLAEVIDNDFTHHSRFQVTGDRISINIKVVKKEEKANEDVQVVKSRWLHYEAKGGLKITGSVGLNFSQFFDPAQSYSVNNGIIVGEDDGAFTPTVTSFIHFYSYSGKKTSLGGSFGIGFPLTSSGDNQSLQFFVGPSLIFGSGQRIVLNFGLTGGRVSRLARGFKVGDEFDVNLGDIPTRNPYELGLFIGASFNLGGG